MEVAELKTALETTISEKPEAVAEILPVLLETEKAKEVIGNRAEAIYKEKITQEVSGIHSQYDADMFEILGEKPEKLDDGTKQKTYDKIKSLYTELKQLRETKGSLNKDAEVQRLNQEIADLKANGPGAHWEKTFNTEKSKWSEERQTLTAKLQESQNAIIDFKKQADIEEGLRGFKFRDDIPESARQALINSAIRDLKRSSKVEEGKVIYLDENGAQINDHEYKPQNAKGILSNVLKDIIKAEDKTKGGGAAKKLEGSIETTNVEGKDVKKLILQPSQFSTRTEFIKHAEDALIKSGVHRGHDDWDKLKNEAYQRYNVSTLPR